MSILTLADWLQTPQGRYLLEWEEAGVDRLVADIFGYNAVQLGLPEHDFLRASRMSFRFHCARSGAAAVIAEADALPFAGNSLDLVVLPHVLEFARRPHQVLREVERVLVPEGSIVVTGFNPLSLWGMRRLAARSWGELPWQGQYRSLMRIKDWLTLLGFEIQAADAGCYAPPVKTTKWLERWRFMDGAGARWWPIGGAAYLVHGIKRVQGMRLITPQWREKRASANRLSPVAERNGDARKIQ